MAYILSNKKSTYGSPYAFYSVDVYQKSRTPTAVTLRATAYGKLQYSTSTLGTGSGMGLVAGLYIAGTWHTWTLKSDSTKWAGTTLHNAGKDITVSAAMNISTLSASFRVLRSNTSNTAASLSSTACSNIGITKVSSTYEGVKISGEASSQAAATATVSGLPSAVGYARTIDWYLGDVKVGTTSIAANSTTTSYAKDFSGLLPSTTYTLKAVVKYGSTALVTKTVSITTPAETGELKLTPKTTYIVADISGMFNVPNYTRTVEVYQKKTEAEAFVLVKSFEENGEAATVNITGLASNETYDIRVLIKSGTTTLLTLEESITTLTDISLIPTAIIENITQKLGTRECTVTWRTDKAVAGTKYELQSKATGDSHWTTLETFDEVVSPCVVTATVGNVETQFRIASWNYDVVDDSTNYSDRYVFYVRDDFVWDIEKTKGGQFVITASEWNRLAEYAEARTGIKILTVRKDEAITAEIYNTMKNTIGLVNETGIPDKRRGEAISAADIDALRVAINDV